MSSDCYCDGFVLLVWELVVYFYDDEIDGY